jgi:hypothetical protein
MGVPDLTIAVEPVENGSVIYMPLAPKTADDQSAALLCLRLMITNNGNTSVHLNKVGLTFVPASAPLSDSTSLDIAPHTTQEWNFSTAEDVFLSSPAPEQITIALTCDGFSSPIQVTLPLAAYQAPGGGYRFPTDPTLLVPGEFWNGSSGNHGEGAWGSQLFAYDFVVIAFDAQSNQWTPWLPGKNGDNNADSRIWGKHICAVADGIVREKIDGVPNNPHPLKWTSTADLNQQLAAQMALWGGFTNGGGGNHYYIQHGEEVVLYAHMQNGSLNPTLEMGSTVEAGTFLGLAGNAGNSTGPHLHVHAIKGSQPEVGPLRPLPFRDILAVDLSVLTPPYPSAPWATLEAQGPSHTNSAIWPSRRFPPQRLPIWEAAIDPLALILSDNIYTLLTLPDPPPVQAFVKQMRQVVASLSPAGRSSALKRLNAFRGTYLEALDRVLTEEAR